MNQKNLEDKNLKRKKPKPKNLQDLEKDHIIKTLFHYHGSISKAARALGISRAGLYGKMRILNLSVDQFREL